MNLCTVALIVVRTVALIEYNASALLPVIIDVMNINVYNLCGCNH